MFWDYIVLAFNVLTFWQTHLVGLMYLIFLFIPWVFVSLVMKKKKCAGTWFKCIKILLLPVLQVVAVMAFMLILSPIMLDMGEDASWQLPWRMVSTDITLSIGLLGCLAVVAVGLVFIPIVGRLHSFRTLVLGAISLVFVQMLLSYINPALDMKVSYLIPGYSFMAGIVVIAAVLSKVDHYMCCSVSAILRKKFEIRHGVCELVMFPVVSVLGFFPVFIYAAWLA
jgi:hypothetical protein